MEHIKPVWAKKVPPHKIKKLYELNAQGIYDEELVDDVGTSIYARVDSMLMVTSSNLGKAVCIVCRTEIPHSHQKDFTLKCSKCGWSMNFGEYGNSYKKQTLNGYGVLNELNEFINKYPLAKSYNEKMFLIDWLIHTFHGNLHENPSRPTATNLIDANNAEVANLIYTLAYGEGSTVAAEEMDKWYDKHSRSIHNYIDPVTGTIKNKNDHENIKNGGKTDLGR